MTVPFMYNFRSFSNKSATIKLKFDFSHFTPQVRLFFVAKRKLKIFGLHLKFSGKKCWSPDNFEQTRVALG